MNKKLTKLSIALLIIFLISQQVFAQSVSGRRNNDSGSTPAPTTYVLTITSNVVGAKVDINNGAVTGVTNFSTNMAPGSFLVVVSAPGYQSVQKRINFQAAQTVDFQLQPLTAQLNVTANVVGAAVQITGTSSYNGQTPLRASLAMGTYTITVSAPGFAAQTKRITLNSGQNVDFQLRAITSQLNVTSNITGALVQISGPSNTQGNTPFRVNLPNGTYSVTASAPGFTAQTKRVVLNSGQTVDFQLEAITARLNITSNVKGAIIQITGPATVQGDAPMRADLPLGTYSVTASSPGYDSQTQVVNLQKHENVHFDMKRSNASVQIIIPAESLNMKDENARSLIKIYDNGTEISAYNFQIRPGQHTIQIVSGGLMSQTTIIAEAGRTYSIKPMLTLVVE